jgi:hypothetical protein
MLCKPYKPTLVLKKNFDKDLYWYMVWKHGSTFARWQEVVFSGRLFFILIYPLSLPHWDYGAKCLYYIEHSKQFIVEVRKHIDLPPWHT